MWLTVPYQMQVQGQVADLTDLQRILQRSEQKLSNAQQQNMTVRCHSRLLLVKESISLSSHAMSSAFAVLQRWAVYSAATMLTKYKKEYLALQTAMQQRASIDKCVAAIEQS